MAFANVRFPTDLSYGMSGGPGFSTSIVEKGNGAEVRVSRWDRSRRRFNAAYAVRSYEHLAEVRSFFEARRGPAEGFRFKDWFDYTTAQDGKSTPTALDQYLGVGNGTTTQFQLQKRYQSGPSVTDRPITKPVEGTVVVGIDGVVVPSTNYTVDLMTGVITFNTAPAIDKVVSAGCEYDIPVRFGELPDEVLYATYDSWGAGSVPEIPIVELIEEVNVPSDYVAGGVLDREISSDLTLSLSLAAVYTVEPTTSGLGVRCPTPTNLPLGRYFTVINISTTHSLALKDHTGSTIVSIPSGGGVEVYLLSNASSVKYWCSL